MTGPLKGIKVVEFAGIGPGPFCGMVLADLGAQVVRIDRRANRGRETHKDVASRNKRSLCLDLKRPQAVELALKLLEGADALIEGFRPGVMERLGLGPEEVQRRNPRLVYGRMTGWGQEGPLAEVAGHDINYIALSGALAAIGRRGERPVPPLNLVGDFGGGGMLLALGLVAALFEARGSGRGQVVDAAMTDGSALLMAMLYGMANVGLWSPERGVNMLDGAAHFYDTYATADGKYVAIGSIEPQFYAQLRQVTGLTHEDFDAQMERDAWPDLKARLAEVMATKTRDEWCELMEGTDICFAPVLDMAEAPHHAHNRARQTFVEAPDGGHQPAPAPRFSRTPATIAHPGRPMGADGDAILAELGLDAEAIKALAAAEAI